MQEKYNTLYQLTGSSTKQGLQMPTCNNLDQSRIHHLEKNKKTKKKPYPQHHYKVLHSPPPPKKKKKKKKKNQTNKQKNKQITHDQEFTI